VTHKPAAAHETPLPPSHTAMRDQVERDTLNDTPELRFLRDEIEALLGSATVRRALRAPSVSYADDHVTVTPEELAKDAAFDERDTEPNVDVQLLREAVRAAGK
jgi:hypothetical protein